MPKTNPPIHAPDSIDRAIEQSIERYAPHGRSRSTGPTPFKPSQSGGCVAGSPGTTLLGNCDGTKRKTRYSRQLGRSLGRAVGKPDFPT